MPTHANREILRLFTYKLNINRRRCKSAAVAGSDDSDDSDGSDNDDNDHILALAALELGRESLLPVFCSVPALCSLGMLLIFQQTKSIGVR